MSAPSYKQALGRLMRTQLSAPSLLACQAHWPMSSAAFKTVMPSHHRIKAAAQTLASCICDTGCDDGPIAARSLTSCSCKPLRLSCNHVACLTRNKRWLPLASPAALRAPQSASAHPRASLAVNPTIIDKETPHDTRIH